jgi:hypothetical protein
MIMFFDEVIFYKVIKFDFRQTDRTFNEVIKFWPPVFLHRF